MSVGEDLARAREACGMSVEDVSSATRIRAGLIRSIEADDFDACGGAVYARGHLRSIARAIGADPDPLVAEFDRTHQPEEPMHVAKVFRELPAPLARGDHSRFRKLPRPCHHCV